jgi:hypothetical protein
MADQHSHGSSAIEDGPRRRGFPLWLAALLGLAVLGLLFFLLTADRDGEDTAATSATTPEQATATQAAIAPGSEPAAAPGAESFAGAITAGGTPLLALPEGGLSTFAQQAVEAGDAPVQSVVSDEGFWVGPNEGQRIFVVLPTQGEESAPRIEPGQHLQIAGTVRRLPETWGETFGVSPAEGAALLAEQGHYIEATAVAVR